MARLATFVHVSDLHFGVLDSSSLDAANPWWMNLPTLDGFLGHSQSSITALDRSFAALNSTEGAGLIITGDLTTCGNASEFQLFDTYAGHKPSSSQFNYLGLRTPDWKKTSIPGNHDNWPGMLTMMSTPKMLGTPNAMLYKFFHDLPRVLPAHSLSLGYQLRFIWINSDADVGFKTPNRAWARGSFVSELEKAEAQLPKPADKEIRVLCIHHSPTFSGSASSLGALEIDRRSRQRVAKFIVDNRVSVVLCGHIHNPPTVEINLAEYLDGSVRNSAFVLRGALR